MNRGFTRFELLVVTCTITFLGTLLLPVFGDRYDAEQAVCANNMRQIGQGLHLWGNDYGDRPPWQVPYTEGGSQVRGTPKPPWGGLINNAWFQFSWLSNTLVTPAVLVDPADPGKSRAMHWGNTSDGGLGHANFRNRAVSYQIGLDAFPFTMPALVLLADRTLPWDGQNAACYSGVGVANVINHVAPRDRAWLDGVHPGKGNLLLTDGGILQLGNEGLSAHWRGARTDDNGSSHFLSP